MTRLEDGRLIQREHLAEFFQNSQVSLRRIVMPVFMLVPLLLCVFVFQTLGKGIQAPSIIDQARHVDLSPDKVPYIAPVIKKRSDHKQVHEWGSISAAYRQKQISTDFYNR